MPPLTTEDVDNNLQDVHICSLLHLKLKHIPNYIWDDVLPDQLLENIFTPTNTTDHDNENMKITKSLDGKTKACFFYYYGQFDKMGIIFIGYSDGSIEMVALFKSEGDYEAHIPRRFSMDSSRKRQRCHQAAITGILCFSVVENGMPLLMTSCADGFVKFWLLDIAKVDGEKEACIRLFSIGRECDLGSKVVSLKFVFNEVYYSICKEKDVSMWNVFHVIAMCKNGDIYRWDPALIPKVIMTEASRYTPQNIFTLLNENTELQPEYIEEIKNDTNLEIVCATLSQKLTSTSAAFIVCCLSNGMIVHIKLAFTPPEGSYNESRSFEEDYRLTNISITYEPLLENGPPKKIVEVFPFTPNNSFHILSSNYIFDFHPMSKGVVRLMHENVSTICDQFQYASNRQLNNTIIPIEYVSQPFTIAALCWVVRGKLLAVGSEEGKLLLFSKEENIWYEVVCLEYTLLKYSEFSITHHKTFSDIFISTIN